MVNNAVGDHDIPLQGGVVDAAVPINEIDNEEEHHHDDHAEPNVAEVAMDEEVVDNTIDDDLAGHPAIIALQQSEVSFLITDARLPGNPIVYASQGFFDLTGYAADQVLGRNCRFMQGPDTDPAAIARIRHSVENEENVVVDLLNYRRDGTTFWNRLMISVIHNGLGEVTHCVGVQCPVVHCLDPEIN